MADFKTPVFEEYLKANDLNGYMTKLWEGVENNDSESVHALLYLAVKTNSVNDFVPLATKLFEGDLPFLEMLEQQLQKELDKLSEQEQEDEHKVARAVDMAYTMTDMALRTKEQSYFYRFGEAQNDLLRGYLHNVGRPENFGKEDEEEQDEVPLSTTDERYQELKEYWKQYHSNDDTSACQEESYRTAMPYAEQGDPYAMYIVGHLLHFGIKTKYSSPGIVILKPDEDKALEWLKKAADADIPEADYELYEYYKTMYYRSDKTKYEDEWKHYMNRGAELGNINCRIAQYTMAEQEQNYEEAFRRLKALVEDEKTVTHELRLKLAEYYELGKGTEIDPKQAFELTLYVYDHSTGRTPYDSSNEDAGDKLIQYYNEGFGTEVNYAAASKIRRQRREDDEYLDDILSR